MPRGRPASAKSPTRYLNSKRRVIYHISGTNKFVAKSEKGAAVYNPKVAYVKSPGGTERKLANTKARPPRAIRPKATRRVRVNYGVKRGAYAGPHVGNLPALFASMSPVKRRVGRPRKMVAWNLPNPMGAGMRRVRKNKDVKRGPRGAPKKLLAGNPFAPLM